MIWVVYGRAMTRPAPPPLPLQADERTMLLAFLEFYRMALVDRALGLDHGQLQVAVAPSSLTLSRLIGHMTLVEQTWFCERFDGEDIAEPWFSFDWDADRDSEMAYAQTLDPAELFAQFDNAVADSRRRIDEAVSLDQLSKTPNQHGEHWSMRWILIHMIEEYARHCGHADLIRESIDGDVAG